MGGISKKISVFSDLHIHNYVRFDKDGSRLNNTLKALVKLFDYNDKNGISTTLFAGDLFDSRKAVPTIVLNKTTKCFKYLYAKYPKQIIYAISGNHDQPTKNLEESEEVHSLQVIAELHPKRFILINNKVQELEEGVVVAGIPYYDYKEDFFGSIKKINEEVASKSLPKILMIHQTPKNKNEKMPFDVDATDKVFSGWDLVLCGHVHSQERLLDRYWIIGSPLHRDLGDEGSEKGFMVFDVDRLSGPTKVPLNFPIFRYGKEEEVNGSKDYVVPIVGEDASSEGGIGSQFLMNTAKDEMIVAFCEEVGKGKEKDLVDMGISFLS